MGANSWLQVFLGVTAEQGTYLTSVPQLTAQCKKVNGVIWEDWG